MALFNKKQKRTDPLEAWRTWAAATPASAPWPARGSGASPCTCASTALGAFRPDAGPGIAQKKTVEHSGLEAFLEKSRFCVFWVKKRFGLVSVYLVGKSRFVFCGEEKVWTCFCIPCWKVPFLFVVKKKFGLVSVYLVGKSHVFCGEEEVWTFCFIPCWKVPFVSGEAKGLDIFLYTLLESPMLFVVKKKFGLFSLYLVGKSHLLVVKRKVWTFFCVPSWKVPCLVAKKRCGLFLGRPLEK